jgi:hypothetical protein
MPLVIVDCSHKRLDDDAQKASYSRIINQLNPDKRVDINGFWRLVSLGGVAQTPSA